MYKKFVFLIVPALLLSLSVMMDQSSAATFTDLGAVGDIEVGNDDSLGPDSNSNGSGMGIRNISTRRRVAFVQYDISGLLSGGEEFTQMTISYYTHDQGDPFDVYGVIESQDDIADVETLTWNTAPGVQNDPTPPSDDPVALDLADVEGPLMSIDPTDEAGVVDTVEASQELLNFFSSDTDGTVILMLATTVDGDQAIIRSTEHDYGGVLLSGETGAANGPMLISPVDVENLADYTPTLLWNAPPSYEPGHYYIYLDPNQANVAVASGGSEPDPASPMIVNAYQLPSEPNEYTVITELAHGERFYWKVEAYNTAEPNYYSSRIASFTTMPDEPVITQHPISQTAPKNAEVTLSVTALNASGYQWYKDGSLMGGETGSSLVIPKMTKANEGYYYCKVFNASVPEGIDSDTARLMVQRRVAWWNFDDQNIHSDIEHPADPNEDYFAGLYYDPNDATPDPEFNSMDPSPAGGSYIIFSGDTVESDDESGEAILVEPNEFFNFYPLGVTASAWVQINNPSGWSAFASKHDRTEPAPYEGWVLLKNGTNGVFTTRQSADNVVGNSGRLASVNEDTGNNWHLVTGTYDGQETRIYVDGALENSESSTAVMDTHSFPLVIGAETSTGFSPTDGLIDNFELYNYALSRYDVAKLYTNLVPGAEICIEDVVGVEDMDFNDDCIVDIKDLTEFASDWLDCSIVPTCIP